MVIGIRSDRLPDTGRNFGVRSCDDPVVEPAVDLHGRINRACLGFSRAWTG